MSSVPIFAPSGSGGGSTPFEGFDFGGSNQYMNYPTASNSSPSSPYSITGGTQGYGQAGLPYSAIPGYGGVGSSTKVGGTVTVPTLDPALTGSLAAYLQGQVGQGLPAFTGSETLPSSGEQSGAGTLTAPLTGLMQQLQQFFMGQSPGVTGGASSTTPGGTSSSPLSYILPMFQSEMTAMNQPIQEQLANLKEQYGSMGLTDSSAAATGLSDFASQTAATQESMLGQLTMQALPIEQTDASSLQSYDQSAITNALQQYEYNLPQNNPLNNEIYGMSTTYPPTTQQSGGVGAGLLASIPGLASGALAGLGAAGSGAGGIGSILKGLAAI